MFNPESENRIKVVGEQCEIEHAVANSKIGKAVFFVPTLLTPMYIPLEAVEIDREAQLYRLKPDYPIPDGLIPQEKLENPEQLNTVLERVLSVNGMLEKGSDIIILYVNRERKKVDGKEGFVDDSNIKALEKEYSNSLKLVAISETQYETYKESGVCAATYYYDSRQDTEQSIPLIKGVNATQIREPNTPNPWNILEGEAVKPSVDSLNKLLDELGLPPLGIQETAAKVDNPAAVSVIVKQGVFKQQQSPTLPRQDDSFDQTEASDSLVKFSQSN